MRNQEIAQIFRQIALILEIKGENVFKIRAYVRAAEQLEGLSDPIETFVAANRLTDIPGIGKDLSARIAEYCLTGKIALFDELSQSIPAGLLELLRIPSIGPKTVQLLYATLGIDSVAALQAALDQGKLDGLPGVKEKTIANIRHGIELLERSKERMTLAEASRVAETFVTALKKNKFVDSVTCAGSLRRAEDTVGDIDMLVVSAHAQDVMDTFVRLPAVTQVQAHGSTKSSVRIADGTQVDCRVVEVESFGAALVYFTGSKNFNIKIRHLAIQAGLKVNEYGVFRGEKRIAGKTEKDVFRALGLPYIEPELREDNGEIEAALSNTLPELVCCNDIRGDLHCHSTWSDGASSIAEMALACQKRGYSYVAITDHSQSLRVAHGVSVADLKKKKREIDALNKTVRDFKILFGTEADIDNDGVLDYPDDVLREFDIVVGAIHTGFKQSAEQITRRLVNACKNKYVHIIAHPTGRLWGVRDAYPMHFEEVCRAASDTGTALEINAFPDRLDVNDELCRMAKKRGVRFSIDTDSHHVEHLQAMRFGVSVARRGWLTKDDILNTQTLSCLQKELVKK
ncbi:MAG TPA: DNA polymerase/3'-5' exonuclease PolX [Candidatus Omnitrophota bacterium]|nr:DNA polymerase/3'-5' exonuclease PolX [Candidatus Omnitrophota bacterium]